MLLSALIGTVGSVVGAVANVLITVNGFQYSGVAVRANEGDSWIVNNPQPTLLGPAITVPIFTTSAGIDSVQ